MLAQQEGSYQSKVERKKAWKCLVNPNKLNKFAIVEGAQAKWGINQSKHNTDKYGKRKFEGYISFWIFD